MQRFFDLLFGTPGYLIEKLINFFIQEIKDWHKGQKEFLLVLLFLSLLAAGALLGIIWFIGSWLFVFGLVAELSNFWITIIFGLSFHILVGSYFYLEVK